MKIINIYLNVLIICHNFSIDDEEKDIPNPQPSENRLYKKILAGVLGASIGAAICYFKKASNKCYLISLLGGSGIAILIENQISKRNNTPKKMKKSKLNTTENSFIQLLKEYLPPKNTYGEYFSSNEFATNTEVQKYRKENNAALALPLPPEEIAKQQKVQSYYEDMNKYYLDFAEVGEISPEAIKAESEKLKKIAEYIPDIEKRLEQYNDSNEKKKYMDSFDNDKTSLFRYYSIIAGYLLEETLLDDANDRYRNLFFEVMYKVFKTNHLVNRHDQQYYILDNHQKILDIMIQTKKNKKKINIAPLFYLYHQHHTLILLLKKLSRQFNIQDFIALENNCLAKKLIIENTNKLINALQARRTTKDETQLLPLIQYVNQKNQPS